MEERRRSVVTVLKQSGGDITSMGEGSGVTHHDIIPPHGTSSFTDIIPDDDDTKPKTKTKGRAVRHVPQSYLNHDEGPSGSAARQRPKRHATSCYVMACHGVRHIPQSYLDHVEARERGAPVAEQLSLRDEHAPDPVERRRVPVVEMTCHIRIGPPSPLRSNRQEIPSSDDEAYAWLKPCVSREMAWSRSSRTAWMTRASGKSAAISLRRHPSSSVVRHPWSATAVIRVVDPRVIIHHPSSAAAARRGPWTTVYRITPVSNIHARARAHPPSSAASRPCHVHARRRRE